MSITESEITPERKTLADDVAEDFLIFTQASLKTIEEIVRGPLGDAPIDVVVQPLAHRRKKLLIADMDSTIIEQECIDELAEYAGKRAEISDITERAMRGELDFEEALDARIAMLADKGLTEDSLEACYQDRIRLSDGARTTVRTMANNGAHTALVSDGFTFFTERVGAALGMAENRANTLVFNADKMLEKVARPILGKAAKQAALEEMCATHNKPINNTYQYVALKHTIT